MYVCVHYIICKMYYVWSWILGPGVVGELIYVITAKVLQGNSRICIAVEILIQIYCSTEEYINKSMQPP